MTDIAAGNQIFRHFGDEAALALYAKGAWRGSGVQAGASVHPDIPSHVTVVFRGPGVVFVLAHGSLRKGTSGGLPGMKTSFREKLRLGRPTDIKADLAVFEENGTRFEFQALDERRAYATIKNQAGLVFAGALKRSRIYSLLALMGII